MVLLHAARVLAAGDKQAAKETFAAGLALAESLAPDFPFPGVLLEEAVRLGAVADPPSATALFRRLPPDDALPRRRSVGTSLVAALADAGEFDLALALLEDPACEVGGAAVVCLRAPDPAVRLRALHAAHARWQARPEFNYEFHYTFAAHRGLLPPDEAERWADEIRRTDPERPLRDAEEPSPKTTPHAGIRSGGKTEGTPQELYRQDTDPQSPNRAPSVFWPSCHAYQTEFHSAGQRQAPNPDALLAAIPDLDIALLAAIAYAAGAQGLPPPAGARITAPVPAPTAPGA
jgi:hypothetical protein